MKRALVMAILVLSLATVMLGFANTVFTSVDIVSSTINSTAIGQTSPSVGLFTDFKMQGLTNGSGWQTMRNTSCTTAASAGSSCNSTFTWPVSFGDTNYTVSCYMQGTADLITLDSFRLTSATQINVTAINTPGNSTATSGTVHCIGIHDAI